MIQRFAFAVVVLFPISEIALGILKRSRGRSAQSEDRGSLRVLWIGIVVGIAAGIASESVSATRFSEAARTTLVIALVLMLVGLAIRWIAILTLGRFFTVDVAIHSGHEVVQAGLYRIMRHPSYTGLLIAFTGLGVFFGNWLSLVALMIPIGIVVGIRVSKEERALLESLGPAYADYCKRTKRFIPWVV